MVYESFEIFYEKTLSLSSQVAKSKHLMLILMQYSDYKQPENFIKGAEWKKINLRIKKLKKKLE